MLCGEIMDDEQVDVDGERPYVRDWRHGTDQLDLGAFVYERKVERCALGFLMREDFAELILPRVSSIVPALFAEPRHQDIMSAIVRVRAAGQVPSPVSVAAMLGESSDGLVAEDLLAMTFLDTDNNDPFTAFRILTSLALWRTQRQAARNVIGGLRTQGATFLYRKGLEMMLRLEGGIRDECEAAVIQQLREEHDRLGARGPLLGFPKLDAIVNGMAPGELWLLAGRPGMGKTALMQQMVEHVGIAGHGVCVLSLEMTSLSFYERAVARFSGVLLADIARGGLRPAQRELANKWALWLLEHADSPYAHVDLHAPEKGKSFTVMSTQVLNLAQRSADKLRTDHGVELGLIVVDYFGLLRDRPEKGQSSVNLIEEQTRNLQAAARELKVPILVLGQLNRDLGKRRDKRPVLTDLRGSGSLEQDADGVIMIHREGYYLPDGPAIEPAELIIAKNRSGTMGTAHVFWDGARTEFTEEPPVSPVALDVPA